MRNPSSYGCRKPKRFGIILSVGLAVFLCGCATSEKIVSQDAAPSAHLGYVGGNFVVKKDLFTTAFVLTNQADSKEYILSFTTVSGVKAGNTETNLVELPPGRYRVSHWIVFNSYWGPGAGGREFKKAMDGPNFLEAFDVKPNEIVFLGKFAAEGTWTPGLFSSTTVASWRSERLSTAEALEITNKAYPKFSSSRLKCIACIR
ncbi:hypothetical protein [Variovorax fucosicus]|uniref:hypothetical protein n=1 Tax=Variovorax fucosicus TaxID=3053517 RepID=UPI00257683E0|nr:hypothetical protein [Variovorax sp. J22G47]MDM0056838.1 hypothetical protein [Variovorax sp. J22G47]